MNLKLDKTTFDTNNIALNNSISLKANSLDTIDKYTFDNAMVLKANSIDLFELTNNLELSKVSITVFNNTVDALIARIAALEARKYLPISTLQELYISSPTPPTSITIAN